MVAINGIDLVAGNVIMVRNNNIDMRTKCAHHHTSEFKYGTGVFCEFFVFKENKSWRRLSY